ncbi:MAG: hypothetical protein ACFFCG_03185 [Promethearchaeota archaeon]
MNANEITVLKEQKNVVIPRYSIMIFYGLALYGALMVINVLFSSFYGFNLITNYISELGSKKVIPFPYFHDLTCVFGGLITIPTNYYAKKKLCVQYKKSKHSIFFLEVGVVFGIVGSVSYIFLGVFSVDRAGPGQIFHGLTAFLSFGGYIISIFFFSLNIILSHKCKLKNLGAFGLVVPVLLVCLYSIITKPVIEWFLLSSIAFFMFFLEYYIFKA